MRYIAHLAKTLSVTSINQYMSAIRLLSAEMGQANPLPSWPVRSLLQGIKRGKGNATKRKLPINPTLLLQIRRHLDLRKPADQVLWAAFLTAFFTLLRRSNLLPSSANTFNACLHPCRRDLRLLKRGFALIVKSTKTIQFSERQLQLPIPCIPDHPLCPASAIIAILCLKPELPPCAPLFAYPTMHGMQVLTQHTFTQRLQTHLKRVGLEPSLYGTHSFRRGGASWAFRSGMPGEAVQILGDWRSDCYKRYLEIDMDTKFTLYDIFSNSLPSYS